MSATRHNASPKPSWGFDYDKRGRGYLGVSSKPIRRKTGLAVSRVLIGKGWLEGSHPLRSDRPDGNPCREELNLESRRVWPANLNG